MSGGSPTVGGGYVRQRHSQGYFSSGDDLEDDACSRSFTESPPFPTTRSWVEVVENFLWFSSVLFIIYYGDRHYNFIYILWRDNRIRSTLAWGLRKSSEKWEISSIAALPFLTLNGLLSSCLLTYALWPIWSFLTLPLVFTLFMVSMVILPNLVLRTFKPQADMFRTD
ncbi:unnamed protein product [Cuscuta europaea]|uniref:Transmembrane protein n=1 Tax=Cuscuta europaea TaxID=41803 RepID=A0A9P1E8E8_CUSEU|nr:unnamed protein product [Cuscuta europaea]